MDRSPTADDRLLKPGEVGAIFLVDPKTVNRWATDGLIKRIKTPGKHSRYLESDVRGLLKQNGVTNPDSVIANGLKRYKAMTPAAPRGSATRPAHR
jgi:hypothetical protein